MSTNSLLLRLHKGWTIMMITMLLVQPFHLIFAEEVTPPTSELETAITSPADETEDEAIASGPEISSEELLAATSSEVTATTTSDPSLEIIDTTETATSTESLPATTDTSTASSTPSAVSEEWTCSTHADSSQQTSQTTVLTGGDPFATTTTLSSTSTPLCAPLSNELASDWIFSSATSTDATSTPLLQETLIATSTDPLIIATSTPPMTATTTIDTGNSVATANVLNIANTNTVNSDGAIIFSNLSGGSGGAVDLRPVTSESGAIATGSCSIASCEGNSGVNVTLNNDAHIDNFIDVSATSGENTIDNAGNAVINTGDAFAALNLVNIANVNFVDSQYLLVALNSFKSVNGDIIFPNLESFFGTKTSSPSVMNLDNTATIENNVNTNANSGSNETDNAGESIINSGNAHSFANTFNQINTTLGANDTVSILLNIHGTWNGGLVNAPPQLWMTQSEDGTYHISGATTTGDGSGNLLDGALITGSSSALIHNNVNVNAVSGMNSILNADSALITTGNAYAGANLINIANANVIGRNWLLGIINIFGDFNGNIAFGRPDLWIGARIETPPPFHNDSELNYTFTIMNKGDAPASDIALFDTYDTAHLEILESSLPYTKNDNGQLLWNIGRLPQGARMDVTMKARIKDAAPGTMITSELLVRGKETDNNFADNRDRISITTYIPPHVGGSSGSGGSHAPAQNNLSTANASSSPTSGSAKQLLPVEIIRSTATTTIRDMGTKNTQSITIKNPNNEIMPSVTLKDTLRDPSGIVIHNEVWDLGTILANEEITIGYDITFSPNATSGTYVLSSMISRPNVLDTIYAANGAIFLSYEVAAPTIPQIITQVEKNTQSKGEILGVESGEQRDNEKIEENGGVNIAYAQETINSIITTERHKDLSLYVFAITLALLLLMIAYDTVSSTRSRK
jgi:hypothetical protein